MARTAFAGGLAVSVATDAAAGGTTAGALITIGDFGGGMNALVYDKPPSELHDINKGKLAAMGVEHEASLALTPSVRFQGSALGSDRA